MINIKKEKRSLKKNLLINKISFPSGLSFVLDSDELLQIEKTNSKHVFGIAVDLGTTSICVSLCNLESGQELANATCDSHQDEFAEMLLNTKNFVSGSKAKREIISQTILTLINQAIDQCIQKSGADRNNIYIGVLVGSPVMQHIITAVPEEFSEKSKKEILMVKAGSVGIKINPAANIKFIPGFNDYIGSDILAAILSLKIMDSSKISVCVDLGMRAKIILGNKDGVFVSSMPINSVFEGHNIKCGMLTQPGAIEWARINMEKVDILTIGHVRPQGICGSGIIDIVSEMLSNDILKADGKLKDKAFVVYQDKKDKVEITQDDIKKIQQSKSAISAALDILMKKMKFEPEKIHNVYVSGQLGDYLNPDNLIKIGLIPECLRVKTKYAGNASFLGAKLALLNKQNMRRILKSAVRVKHINLEDDMNFKQVFKQYMPFPKQSHKI